MRILKQSQHVEKGNRGDPSGFLKLQFVAKKNQKFKEDTIV